MTGLKGTSVVRTFLPEVRTPLSLVAAPLFRRQNRDPGTREGTEDDYLPDVVRVDDGRTGL